ncbi:MAG: hypothetical protein HYX33_02520 [Actinobacteria bacterium]|nr:hypothetical protein [Actinomycetota bacterium]
MPVSPGMPVVLRLLREFGAPVQTEQIEATIRERFPDNALRVGSSIEQAIEVLNRRAGVRVVERQANQLQLTVSLE